MRPEGRRAWPGPVPVAAHRPGPRGRAVRGLDAGHGCGVCVRPGGGTVIRVLLVDDHASFRQPLAFMLEREPDITVVGQAGTLAEARGLLHGVDIAVIDLALPDGNGTQLIRELHGASPQSQALVLTGRGDPVEYAQAVEAGAAGVLQKSVGIGDIVDAIRRLHAGEALLSPQETIAMLRLAARQRERDREALAAARR